MIRESAVLIPVPEAEGLVGDWRLKHDEAARLGVPAHVTLLYPFAKPDEIEGEVLEELRTILSNCESFAFSLTRTGRFHSTEDGLYLAPEPTEPAWLKEEGEDGMWTVRERFPFHVGG